MEQKFCGFKLAQLNWPQIKTGAEKAANILRNYLSGSIILVSRGISQESAKEEN